MAEEAVRRDQEDPLESAIDDIRRGAQAVRAGSPELTARGAQQLALIEWARRADKLRPSNFVDQYRWTSSGAEHSVYHDERAGLGIKVTHPDSYGHSPSGPAYRSTPLEYLSRLYWQNALFGDDVRVEAVTLDDEGHVQVIHSQPWIQTDYVNPVILYKEEIDEYFAKFGFSPASLNLDAPLYYNSSLDLIVADAHEQNVLRDVFGTIMPIDIVIGTPGPELRDELLAAITSRLAGPRTPDHEPDPRSAPEE